MASTSGKIRTILITLCLVIVAAAVALADENADLGKVKNKDTDKHTAALIICEGKRATWNTGNTSLTATKPPPGSTDWSVAHTTSVDAGTGDITIQAGDPGTATIIVHTDDEKVTYSIDVTVKPCKDGKIDPNPPAVTPKMGVIEIHNTIIDKDHPAMTMSITMCPHEKQKAAFPGTRKQFDTANPSSSDASVATATADDGTSSITVTSGDVGDATISVGAADQKLKGQDLVYTPIKITVHVVKCPPPGKPGKPGGGGPGQVPGNPAMPGNPPTPGNPNPNPNRTKTGQNMSFTPNDEYAMFGPSLVATGETFTAEVVGNTPTGPQPLDTGDMVTFNGTVLPVQQGGKVKLPAIPVAELTSIALLVLKPNDTTTGYVPAGKTETPVESIPVSADTPTKVEEGSDIVTGSEPYRVVGTGLDKLTTAKLVGENGAAIALTDPVGSSLEEIYAPPGVAIPAGNYHFEGTDGNGNVYDAPNQSVRPVVSLSGEKVDHIGQRGTITLTSNADTLVDLTGGEPQITLDRTSVMVYAGQPATVAFTAHTLGSYTLTAHLHSPDEPATGSDAPVATAKPVRFDASYDAASDTTTVHAPIDISNQDGTPRAGAHADVALSSGKSVLFGHVVTDSAGHADYTATLPGKVAADSLSGGVYSVGGATLAAPGD